MQALGIIAALGAATCWAGTALTFSRAGRQVGSDVVNLWRLMIAVTMLSGLVLLFGSPLPTRPAQWTWLALSGAVGLALGDACYFQALVLLGPRRAALIMAFNPVPGAILDYLVFGEALGPTTLLGVALTLGGITWVIAERVAVSVSVPQAGRGGIACAVGGALCQAVGLVLSKLAMNPMRDDLVAASGVDPHALGMGIALSVTQIRMVVAAIIMVTWMLARPDLRARAGRAGRSPRVIALITLGAFLGPIGGVWCSQLAILNVPVGVAATLMSTSPIMVIPMVRIIEGEDVSPRALLGALAAVAGVALLAL